MSESHEQAPAPAYNEQQNGSLPVAEPAAQEAPNPHAEAGRKGAHRIHDLIRLGRLYEQEHDLKRGRLRLRQLIAEGKLYEQEHGLHRPRPKRPRKEQVLRAFLKSLVWMVKPAYRVELTALVQTLAERKSA